jgi:hypothetical protein
VFLSQTEYELFLLTKLALRCFLECVWEGNVLSKMIKNEAVFDSICAEYFNGLPKT